MTQRTHRLLLALLLFVLTVVAHIGIVATPGFFSHDEWQKFDHIQEHGFPDFAAAYGRVYAGTEFGVPVRPLGFLQQGVSSTWMERAPIVAHLFDVLLHSGITLIVFGVLLSAGVATAPSWIAALLFSTSPLTTMSTGWLAASFDQWYTLFAILACWLSYLLIRDGVSISRLFALLLCSACAILSKETSLILPGLIAITAYVTFLRSHHTSFPIKVAAIAIVVSTVPLAIYLIVRIPALLNSVAGHSHASYTPSIWNVPENMLNYAAYPFLVSLAELGSIDSQSLSSIVVAITFHGLLAVGVWRYFGFTYATLYLIAYYIFLAPILSLHVLGSHYLYGSAIPMALALGAVIWSSWSNNRFLVLGISVFGSLLLLIHSIQSQAVLYADGACQSVFLETLDTRMAIEASRGTKVIVIDPAEGTRAHVGIRAITGRERYAGSAELPAVRFSQSKLEIEKPIEQSVVIQMTKSCKVR